jgi:dTDP-glucose pyrophosphorylase
MNTRSIEESCIGEDADIQEVIVVIEASGGEFALVVDATGKLVGMLTDGDLRRGMLAGFGKTNPIRDLLAFQASHHKDVFDLPLVVEVGASDEDILSLMNKYGIYHIPVVDAEGLPVRVALLTELIMEEKKQMKAVLMAGGFGTRMRPLTQDTPKPMLQVGGKPILEHIIRHLSQCDIQHVNITTHYKGGIIRDHFGDGAKFGVDIDYVDEDSPLGTAGALSLMERPEETFLVMNGDVLTNVNIASMHRFHLNHGAMLTVGVRPHEVDIPFGVVDLEGVNIVSLTEKPIIRNFINTGIYLLEPRALDFFPENGHFDMTDLIDLLIRKGKSVCGYPIREYWRDVGCVEDIERAQQEVEDVEKIII